MESQVFKNVITIMGVLSCIGAVVSGYYAYIAGKLSKGGIAYQFFVRYSDEKMRQALTKLGNFKREHEKKHGAEFIDLWYASFINKDEWAMELEESRHIIKYFYRDVATLYQAGCMRYKIAEKICSAGGIYLFEECILPMEDKVNPFRYENEFYPVPEIARKMRKSKKRNK
jgi:hypothetical protein